MDSRTMVVVGRKWNNPQIYMEVSGDGIEVKMSVADFLAAVSQEAGNPALLVTQAGHLSRLQVAAQAVIEGMKVETTAIMSKEVSPVIIPLVK